jgi:hypothetical protein
MKKKNKVTEEEIDVVGSSKRIDIKAAIISGILTVLMLIISFNVKVKSNKTNVEIDIPPSVTTMENMTTTMTPCTSTMITTTTSSSVTTTTPVTTTIVETTTEEVTTEEECVITMPVNIQVVIDEPVQEDPSPEPIIETEPVVEVVEESSTEESIDPPIVEEEPVAVEETEPLEMEYLGNLYITGYVATGNPTASGPYPYVGGVAMSRSYGLPWGTTIYIDGLGYYTLFDTGCSYGVVDVFCNTIPECYDLTSWRDVYIVK